MSAETVHCQRSKQRGYTVTDLKLCRAVSPAGIKCTRPRAHKYNDLSTRNHHTDTDGKAFKGGVKTPAYWYFSNNSYLTEADYQTWMRL